MWSLFLVASCLSGAVGDIGFSVPNDLVKNQLTKVLTQLDRDTIIDKVADLYMGSYDQAVIKEVVPSEIADDFATNLKELLDKKNTALINLKTATEEAAQNAVYDDCLWLGSPPINDICESGDERFQILKLMKDLDTMFDNDEDNQTELAWVDHFGAYVNETYSAIHIPVEIYKGRKDILNALKWSHEIDVAFAKNLAASRKDPKSPALLWQYFGSQLGYLRAYPATKWNVVEKEVDLFDVRRRPWYIQGMNSPKDMFILVDTSGSTKGITNAIMKVAVESLLQTLSDNDFFAVATFSKEAKWLTNCFRGFVQATYWNKMSAGEAFHSTKVQDMANLTRGVEFAFQEGFIEWNKTGRGTGCNQVLVVLTDGDPEYPERVLNMYNPDKQVRIFTYAMGEAPIGIDVLERMACENRGSYLPIRTQGSVRHAVQEYQKHLIRFSADYHLPSVFSDQFLVQSDKRKGFGSLITLTKPVFNTSSNDHSLLGVVGTDLRISELVNSVPAWKLGPNGYGFTVNTNGHVVVHPHTRMRQGYVLDPPSVDFLDLEISSPIEGLNGTMTSTKEAMRNKMVRREAGEEAVTDYVRYGDGVKYVGYKTRRYAWKDLPNGTFSVGVAIPDYQNFYMEVLTPPAPSIPSVLLLTTPSPANASSSSTKFGVTATDKVPLDEGFVDGDVDDGDSGTPSGGLSDSATTTANWKHVVSLFKDNILVDFRECVEEPYDFAAVLDDKPGDDEQIQYTCDRKILNQFKLDLNFAMLAVKEWQAQPGEGFVGRFVAFDSGLLFAYPAEAKGIFQGTFLNSAWFQRTFDNTSQWIFEPLYAEGRWETVAARALNYTKDGKDILRAAIGVTYSTDQMHELAKGNYLSRGVMIDEGGYIVADSMATNETVGQFFGDDNFLEFQYLLEQKVYSQLTFIDWEGACEAGTIVLHESSAAWGLDQMPNLVSLKWWVSSIFWFFSTWSAVFFQVAEGHSNELRNESCVTKYNLTHNLNMNTQGRTYVASEHDELKCDRRMCERTMVFGVMDGLNVHWVFTEQELCEEGRDRPCHWGRGYGRKPIPAKISKASGDVNFCELAENPRERQNPATCYQPPAAEITCGTISAAVSSLLAITTLVF